VALGIYKPGGNFRTSDIGANQESILFRRFVGHAVCV
jgi:hypothetical protein